MTLIELQSLAANAAPEQSALFYLTTSKSQLREVICCHLDDNEYCPQLDWITSLL